MVIREITGAAFLALLMTAWLIFLVTQGEAEITDEQEQTLIGEWRGVWGGYFRGGPSPAPSRPGTGYSTVYNPSEWTSWSDGTQTMWYNAITGEQLPAGQEPWAKYPSAVTAQPTISAEFAQIPSSISYSQILIIHGIDTAKAKARCTYIDAYLSGQKYPVLADFTPGPDPKLEFKVVGNELKFVLKNKVLQGTFRGMTHHGDYIMSTIEMEKYPKK
jgi:hypothetical protein